MRTVSAAAVVLALVVPATAFSGPVRPWVGVDGGFTMYSMSDVNSQISTINSGLAGSGLKMDEIHHGLGAGATLGLQMPNKFSVGVGYERLFAGSDVSDPSGSFKLNVPSNSYRAMAQYSFAGAGVTGMYLGGSAGMVQEAGTIESTGSPNQKVKGSGPLFEMFTGGDLWATPQFAITGTGGYRYAKIGEVKVDGLTQYLANGDKSTIDYSGAFVRAGVKIALMP